jgi:hypothetical protein
VPTSHGLALASLLLGAKVVAVPIYQRREPEHTVLWQCVKEHLPTFLAATAEADRPVPDFVREEFERFQKCGMLEEGCAVVRCESCGFTRRVAFSCKGRGVCCSCIARRMSYNAAYLVVCVLSETPTRQWVLSLPVPLRYLVAWDCEVMSKVIAIFIHAVFRHLRRIAQRELGVRRLSDAQPGAVCNVQRWGGSVNLNPHLHALLTDGVFVREADTLALPRVFGHCRSLTTATSRRYRGRYASGWSRCYESAANGSTPLRRAIPLPTRSRGFRRCIRPRLPAGCSWVLKRASARCDFS